MFIYRKASVFSRRSLVRCVRRPHRGHMVRTTQCAGHRVLTIFPTRFVVVPRGIVRILEPIETRSFPRFLARSSTLCRTERRTEPELALLPRPPWHTIFIESRGYEGSARGVIISLFSLAFSPRACRGTWGVRDSDRCWPIFAKLGVGGSTRLGQRDVH